MYQKRVIIYLKCHRFVTKGKTKVNMAKRISISLDDEQKRLLDHIEGFGRKDAEKVKNILMAYLSEKGYLDRFNGKF